MASISQAAAISGVSRGTVIRWIKAGLVVAKAEHVGNVVVKFVDVAQVQRLASKITTGRPPRGGR